MKQLIDLEHWNRKEHFKFFSSFDDPFFGITTLVDFTDIYKRSKEEKKSFFLYSVHYLLKCVNETKAFKLRIENEQVVLYDFIHVSLTIGREDGTFGFVFFEYDANLDVFIQNAEKEIERVKNGNGLSFSENTGRPDLIRYSALPWFAFSEMKHAVSFGKGDSVPRISTGKLVQEDEKYLLPISILAHHALMDGRNMAELIEKLGIKKKINII
ncbi:MAG: chloramphenicol acetyltransferase [Bacteroidales bacterium]|nr:chloramphenicol acetyltransferase [Bacteroidales bacterium]